MTSDSVGTKAMGEDRDSNTKQVSSATGTKCASDCFEYASTSRGVFLLHESSSENGSECSTSDQEIDMTRDIVGRRMKSSTPIVIPKLKIATVNDLPDGIERRDYPEARNETPIGSAGDCAYNSPNLPRPSKDFSHVMINLRHREVQRVRSCDNVGAEDSDNESCNSLPGKLMSSSVPTTRMMKPKGRRTVRFDETTITVTADLGESAARFRSQWRKKRLQQLDSPSTRFGESKNISICHVDESPVDSPILERAADKGKSIFDVCNYSSFGRYT